MCGLRLPSACGGVQQCTEARQQYFVHSCLETHSHALEKAFARTPTSAKLVSSISVMPQTLVISAYSCSASLSTRYAPPRSLMAHMAPDLQHRKSRQTTIALHAELRPTTDHPDT
jgi:hypothetical protein